MTQAGGVVERIIHDKDFLRVVILCRVSRARGRCPGSRRSRAGAPESLHRGASCDRNSRACSTRTGSTAAEYSSNHHAGARGKARLLGGPGDTARRIPKPRVSLAREGTKCSR